MGLLDDARSEFNVGAAERAAMNEARSRLPGRRKPVRLEWAVELAEALVNIDFPTLPFEIWNNDALDSATDAERHEYDVRGWVIGGHKFDPQSRSPYPEWEYWAVSTGGRWWWEARYSPPWSPSYGAPKNDGLLHLRGSDESAQQRDLGAEHDALLKSFVVQALHRIEGKKLQQPGVITVNHWIKPPYRYVEPVSLYGPDIDRY